MKNPFANLFKKKEKTDASVPKSASKNKIAELKTRNRYL